MSGTRLNSLCGFPEGVVQTFEKTGRIPQHLPDGANIDRLALLQAFLEAEGVEFLERADRSGAGVRMQKAKG